jgi:membrane fusion protein, multidrug efflux system
MKLFSIKPVYSHSRSKPAAYHCLLLIFVLTLLCACAKAKEEKPTVKNRPAPVTVAKVLEKTVPVEIRAIGNVESYTTVAVKPRVGGMIVRQFIRDGQEVSKGDLLFNIDSRPLEITLKEAQARLEKDIALLRKAEADLSRYKNLLEKDAVTQEQYDQTQANLNALRASVRLDEAGVENVRLELEYAAVRSPVSGKAGAVLVNEGNIVKANDDRTLVIINQIQPVYVSFSVPEQQLPAVLHAMSDTKPRVSVFVSEQDTEPETGELAAVDNTVDKSTGTVRLKGLFANPHKMLWPGQFVRVILKLADIQGAIVVPSQAVQNGIEGQYVFVVKSDSTAEMRSVTAGKVLETETLVEKGLIAGETVVIAGHILLVPGAKVEVKEVGSEK